MASKELPPRTRRIPNIPPSCFLACGTTSAYAENTNQGPGHGHRGGNYLRVRGEYRIKAERERKLAELPPRTRRIPVSGRNFFPLSGTTSAYAENTSGRRLRTRLTRNYLRVRGEYQGKQQDHRWREELPPRTRRILDHLANSIDSLGTTSAYAENTRSVTPNCWNGWNYLRVRGEYILLAVSHNCAVELPPRTRRILHIC